MEVKREEKNNRGSFYVEQNGEWLAEMVYGLAAGKMIIYHTEVASELQGKNVGMQLVRTAVEYAREHHIKIVPLCTFAKAVINKVEDFHDVLASAD